MAVLSLVIGITALVAPLAFFVHTRSVAFAIPLGLLAVVLGARARKHRIAAGAPTGIATAGVVTGVIGLLLGAALVGLIGFTIRSLENDPAHKARFDTEKQATDSEFKDQVNQMLAADEISPSPQPKGK